MIWSKLIYYYYCYYLNNKLKLKSLFRKNFVYMTTISTRDEFSHEHCRYEVYILSFGIKFSHVMRPLPKNDIQTKATKVLISLSLSLS